MPVYLKDIDDFRQLEAFKSVLIVPCRFCPAASMAVATNRPYFEFLRRFLKTAPYEEFIDTIKSNLVKKGIKTDVFRSRWLHQFVVCMWTNRRRKKCFVRNGVGYGLVFKARKQCISRYSLFSATRKTRSETSQFG